MGCKPAVFKSKKRPDSWKWCWNCLAHNKIIKGYDTQMEAFASAELHRLFHEESITQTQFMTTSVKHIQLNGAPRLVHLFDQLMAEVRVQSERSIDEVFESEIEHEEEGCP